jgi:poly-gamma-glutamate capsule biosynthesis protein CapA/YwtB (metallophosphatase superfamily)
MSDEVVVLVGGDVIVNRAQPLSLFERCRETLRSADITFANSETAYSTRGAKAANIVGMMRAHPRNLVALGDAGFDVMSFANNHHLDAGPDAFFDTIDGLRAQGVLTCGVGADIAAARCPAVRECRGTKVAFLAYSSILWPGFEAGPSSPGCAPLRVATRYEQVEMEQPGSGPRIRTQALEGDLAALVADVRAAREIADVVIVSMHWGVHFTPVVLAEYETAVARAAIDAGADAILGHHQHILKPIQVYRGKVTFHGLGHLAMDVDLSEHAGSPLLAQMQHQYGDVGVRYRPDYPTYPYPPDARQTVLAQLRIRDRQVAEVSFLPCYINPAGQPEVLDRDDPRFEQVADYVVAISREAGLDTAFKVGESDVRVLT